MARRRKHPELHAQDDPRAPLDADHFLAVAQATLDTLTKDLLARAEESPAITAALKARWAHQKSEQLTAEAFKPWRRRTVVQVAAAWLLSCVFVRTLEDRGLLARKRLAGPGAVDAQRAFTQLAPHLGAREYLLTIFAELDHFPATRRLFEREHNLAWRLAPSPAGAKALVELFRAPDPAAPHFRFGQASTRFLGDLYQDLSEEIRKRFALLQTPDFVEDYILDRTLEPAIAEFGLANTELIDPTCGSGHFLLGAFERLYDRWSEAEPGAPDPRHVEKALAAVHGVDLNPYAVFIAEFRLTLAALDKLGVTALREAPELKVNVVVADSLLHDYGGRGQASFADMAGQDAAAWFGEEFELDDPAGAKRTLTRGFAAVVGNPPYITVKDKARRDAYREAYESAYREYSLAVPFMERFFNLAREGGFVGQITANSFMKREFGKKLITDVLPRLDLTTIVNTSGAYIPGHGTPTVILFGRNRDPVGDTVHAVLARRGEPSTPADPAEGEVWSTIREHGEELDYEDEYITVAAVERELLEKHPWSLEGGGASELKALIESRGSTTLGEVSSAIGFSVITGEDNVLLLPQGALSRRGLSDQFRRRNVVGEEIRDWSITDGDFVVWPYDGEGELLPESNVNSIKPHLWPYRTSLKGRKLFGAPIESKGIPWWGLREVYSDRLRTPMTIGFAFVATHNNFVLDRGGKVFNRTAPIIKLPEDASEADHLALLAYLNSSTACFWMKQVAHDKGSGTDKGKWQDEPAKIAYEFTGTHLAALPLPELSGPLAERGRELGRELTEFGEQRVELLSTLWTWLEARSIDGEPRTPAEIVQIARERDQSLLERMIAGQEQIDWLVYAALFGAPTPDASRWPERVPLGARPFEILAAQNGAKLGIDGQQLQAICPKSWSVETVEQWEALIERVGEHEWISKIEVPDYKRRFMITPKSTGGRPLTFEDQAREALSDALDDYVERKLAAEEGTVSLARLQSLLTDDPIVAGVNEALAAMDPDEPGVDLATILDENSVPFLSAHRFKPSGLEKHESWRETWELQRREDAGEKVGDIPVPPKYAKKDFADARYYKLRGKLDVPKERFIAYPGCASDSDEQPVYGWAGWDHAQRAEALLSLYTARKDEEAWPAERLLPMLAGILELLPWLRQWHDEPDEETGERLGDAYEAWLGEELRSLELTRAELEAWRPPRSRGRRRKKKKK